MDYKKRAIEALNELRESPTLYRAWSMEIRAKIEQGNLTLDNIGTSEVELDELQVRGSESNATRILQKFRKMGTSDPELTITDLQRELKAGNLTLEDIGTSEVELDELRMNGEQKFEAFRLARK